MSLRSTAIRISVLTLLWGAGLTACTAPPVIGQANPDAPPPDFTLEFHAAQMGQPITTPDQLYRSVQCVLDVDRTLRVAVGPHTSHRYFPRVTAVLSPRQVQEVYQLIDQQHLMFEPTSPIARQWQFTPVGQAAPVDNAQPPPTIYTVWITAGGRTHRYQTTPAESPPTARLLDLLSAYWMPPTGPLPP